MCATIGGLQRKLAKPKVKKEPVTTDMLSAVIESLGRQPSLSDVRLATGMLLGFAVFLRFDEMAKLRCEDVIFTAQGMSIHVREVFVQNLQVTKSINKADSRPNTPTEDWAEH